jgi:hypothetical protein
MLASRSVGLRWMSARGLLCAIVGILAGSSCSVLRTDAPTSAPGPSDFQATITRVERSDPGSPAVLIAQLSYAEFLLNGAPGPCAQRLEQAQEQLGSVDANPQASVMFPDGWARAVDIEYRLHLARADCGSEADRDNELRTAVAAARHAVDLYRNMFDYRSMVIMQFDVGVVLRRLGENAAALAALETALDMDREYGFQDDARENYKLLLTWRGEPASDAQVSGLMRDFPKRQAILKFGWRPSDARMTLESHRECLESGQIVRSRAAADFERRIVADADGGWNVSYAHRLTHYDPGVWPVMPGSQRPPMVFSAAPLFADFKVSAAGEFGGVTDSTELSASLASRTQELIRAATPSGNEARALADAAVDAAAASLSPGMLEAATVENYQLETAMWIGATLDQGVWHEVSAPLSLPGMPHVVVQNRVQFAFTHTVPCTADAAVQTCIEIVIRATPDSDALHQVIADFQLPDPYNTRIQTFTASTEARVVIDPATLLPYAREERLYWYASIGKGRKDTTLQSEHRVFATQ